MPRRVTWDMRPSVPRLLIGLALATSGAGAQSATSADAPSATIAVNGGAWVANSTPVTVTFSRALRPDEGEFVLMVGGVDVTALADRAGGALSYRPGVQALPAGDVEVVAMVRRGSVWTELARATMKVLTARGFQRVSVSPAATVGNKGQLAGAWDGIPTPERDKYQDFTLNGQLMTTSEHPRFTIETSSNFVGASRREEALRFGLRQDKAPRLDLADYRVILRSGGTALTVGHTTFGASRHLMNGFSARGTTLSWKRSGTEVGLAAMNAAATVGWDQLIGMTNADHRVLAASLGRELVPTRPGAIRLDLTYLDASMLPRTGFTQGGVVDAEASAGGTVQLTAATPGQRMRLTSGVSRSRFDNPARDRQLAGDSLLVAVERETRGARFVEAGIVPVQGLKVPGFGMTTANISLRHERVDPLYRSVLAPTQSDRQQEGLDASLTLGAIAGQVTLGRGRDNLAGLGSLITTRDRLRTATLAVPLAPLLHVTKRVGWFPTFTLAYNSTHQQGDDVPPGGVFRPTDVPDQLSLNRDMGAQWSAGKWRVGVRRNRVNQDNRQLERVAADFGSGSDALSVGWTFSAMGDLAVDVAEDFQESRERNERQETRRVTLNANLRRGQSTSAVLAFSLLRTDPPNGPNTLNSEQRVEITQPLAFLKDRTGGTRGQLFLRLGRTTARLPDFARMSLDPFAVTTQRQWAVSSGANLRLF